MPTMTESAEGGFTLIELMVVLLIMGILMAIAIPTFLGVTGNARDKGAQSDLTNATLAAVAYYTNHDNYTNLAASELAGINPSLRYGAGDTSAKASVSEVGFWSTKDSTALVSWSAAGICWYATDNEGSNPAFGAPTGHSYAMTEESSANCAKPDFPYVAGRPANYAMGTWYSEWPAAPAGK